MKKNEKKIAYEEQGKCGQCQKVEWLNYCDRCEQKFCDGCLTFFQLSDGTEPYVCRACREKPFFDD